MAVVRDSSATKRGAAAVTIPSSMFVPPKEKEKRRLRRLSFGSRQKGARGGVR